MTRFATSFAGLTGRLGSPYVTGTGGVLLPVGTVITGAGVRDVVIGNNAARYTYAARSPDVNRGSNMLQLLDPSWRDVLSADQGDWAFYGITIGLIASSVTVLQHDAAGARVAFRWTNFDLSTYSGGGVTYYDAITGALLYAQGQSNPNWRRITSVDLTKNVAVNATDPGAFVGWMSDPYLGPAPHLIAADPAWENTTQFGEHEIGDGAEDDVLFASTGAIARYPAWLNRPEWAAAGLGATPNKFWWPGISDATYLGASWVATQPAGFPARQSAGPYWICGISSSKLAARLVALRHRNEIGGWQVSQQGGIVSHFNFGRHSAAGRFYEHQAFVGAIGYIPNSSSAYINEPSAALVTHMGAIAAGLNWPVT